MPPAPTSRVKIAQYMSAFRLADGGVVRAVLDITTVLAARGHELTVLTWDASDIPDAWRAGDGPVRVVPLPRPRGPVGLLPGAGREVAAAALADADVLHLHTPWDPVNRQMAALARRLGLPYVLTVHGMLDDWCMAQRGPKKRLYLALGGRRLLDHAAAVHCTAEAERDQARKWFRNDRIAVVPCVCDLEPFRDLPGPGPAREAFPPAATDRPVLLFLSRLHEKKGVPVLLDAAARLRERGRDVQLLLAGTGEDAYVRRLREQTARLQLDDRVHFLGLVVGTEKVSLFQRADLFLLPTSQENFGFVLIEALAAGTPAVTTRGVDIWAELERSGGACVVDQSPDAFADAVEVLLDDPARRERMGRAGRDWVLRTFDPDVVAAGYERMYEQAAAR